MRMLEAGRTSKRRCLVDVSIEIIRAAQRDGLCAGIIAAHNLSSSFGFFDAARARARVPIQSRLPAAAVTTIARGRPNWIGTMSRSLVDRKHSSSSNLRTRSERREKSVGWSNDAVSAEWDTSRDELMIIEAAIDHSPRKFSPCSGPTQWDGLCVGSAAHNPSRPLGSLTMRKFNRYFQQQLPR